MQHVAYATAWTLAVAAALLGGDSYSTEGATRVVAERSGNFGVIVGCKLLLDM